MVSQFAAGCLLMLLLVSTACFSDENRPSVLFYGGVHSKYVVNPLVEMGIEVDSASNDLAQKLETGKYNVVVVGTLNEADRTAAKEFVSRGGGVFVCSPQVPWDDPADWTATNDWLTELGARPRWEVFQDSEQENIARDVMGCALSWSGDVSPPVDEGVRGVLTLMWNGTTGCEPPMSFDLSPDWKTVVKGSDSMNSRPSTRHDKFLQKWMSEENGPNAPALMAIREAGKGRMAVMAIRYYWIFSPPQNCPTTEAMLTAGAGGKPSDWLRAFANTFRWLAEPSMQAGMGGGRTPDELMNPPVQAWEPAPPQDWDSAGTVSDVPDQSQTRGILGARTSLSSGSETVSDYAKAARAVGLQFIVFLEDSLKMTQAEWDKLVQECEDASDEDFAAIPGLTYEDSQGNHLYAFADEVKFPKPDMVLEDGRLATNRSHRTRALFDYVNEYMNQKILSGYWRHDENVLHFADYKLYNSFPIYSFEDGKQVDDAFDEYQYFMSIGGCHAALAFEIMNSPDQVTERAGKGWQVVSYRKLSEIRSKWHASAWSFHGMMSQYITNGPRILLWQGPNRLINPNGQWWRPDLWEFRILLRAASDAGLKSVTIYNGDKVFRRWYPQGAETFEKELVLSNCQQMGLFPVVEDMEGRKAIGMQSWNRNCIMEEFFCSDRCNFLGNARLRARSGQQVWTQVGVQANMGITPSKGRFNLSWQPAVHLTLNSPTLPIDGAPAGYPTIALQMEPQIPGELKYVFAYPDTYLLSPEIAIGGARHKLGYDPAEEGAEVTPLGHPYEQPQHGGVHANAWGSWHRLVPTLKAEGWTRIYACNWLPEEFRIGWHETYLTTKDTVLLEKGDGVRVMYTPGEEWMLWRGDQAIASPQDGESTGDFTRGAYATLEHPGGSIVVVAMGDELRYDYRGGTFSLYCKSGEAQLPEGDILHYQVAFAGASSGTTTAQMTDFAGKFGVAKPGTTAYILDLKQGKLIDNYLILRLDGQGAGAEFSIPGTDMPGFLPVSVEGLNDNWSVHLLDRARKWPNHRALPIRDGRSFAQLDLKEADVDVFMGHPVTCDHPELKILVSWVKPGQWFVEAHNAGDEVVEAELVSNPAWTLFDFQEAVKLLPGESRTWQISEVAVRE